MLPAMFGGQNNGKTRAWSVITTCLVPVLVVCLLTSRLHCVVVDGLRCSWFLVALRLAISNDIAAVKNADCYSKSLRLR